MACKMRNKRGKDWEGSDPKCFFDSDEHNWNCATANAIRDLCYEGQELPSGIHFEYCDDEKFATFNISEVEDTSGSYIGRCLYVAWYKNRCSTEALWILDGEGDIPRPPTEDELLSIIRYYGGVK